MEKAGGCFGIKHEAGGDVAQSDGEVRSVGGASDLVSYHAQAFPRLSET